MYTIIISFLLLDPTTCSPNDFYCNQGAPRCIPSLWACDGEIECQDGDDEVNEVCGERLSFFYKN